MNPLKGPTIDYKVSHLSLSNSWISFSHALSSWYLVTLGIIFCLALTRKGWTFTRFCLHAFYIVHSYRKLIDSCWILIELLTNSLRCQAFFTYSLNIWCYLKWETNQKLQDGRDPIHNNIITSSSLYFLL